MPDSKLPEKRDIKTESGPYNEYINKSYIDAKIVNYYEASQYGRNTVSLHPTPSSEDTVKAIGEKIGSDEHKFGGKLVSMQVDIYEHLLPKEICVKLSISFGAPEVNIPNLNLLPRLRNETIDIKYGIKMVNYL
ncbi:MAG: hypothetical protein HC836_33775 [Richelia sp. RM2_1_2]|nr:hypothetical protein [Richelia sp. RM2_1_2]